MTMWGDAEEALRLDVSDSLSMLLFQVASPAHIPWNDSRWQELLQGCNVWVHVELRDDPEGVLHQACESMIKHAANSSNLAAFCRLVAQMLDELSPSNNNNSNHNNNNTSPMDQVAEFSERIAIVGKARAAAGSLQLLRIFIHRCLVQYASEPAILTDIFTYRNRDSGEVDTKVGLELVDSLFRFLQSDKARAKIEKVPEMYDTACLAVQLLVVMLSTQLYQPMLSSFQTQQEPITTNTKQSDFFLDLIFEEAKKRRHPFQNNNGKTKWTPKSIVAACLTWQIHRPKSPDRSIAHYHANLAKSVVAAKGEKPGPDGMYENNLIVSAASTQKSYHRSNSIHEKSLGDSSSHHHTSSSSSGSHPSFLLDATRGVLVQASTIILLPFRLVSLALGLWHQTQNGFERSMKNQFNSSLLGTGRTRDVLWISESPLADLASCLFLLLTNNRRAPQPPNNNSIAENNPFRLELSALSDIRWESGHDSGLPDLPDPMAQSSAHLQEEAPLMEAFDREQEQKQQQSQEGSSSSLLAMNRLGKDHHTLMLNFETLFLSFGSILHTEVGALSMYTMLRSSKAFSDTLAVRSDLDTLVLPLLRTLYFASTSRHVSALDFQSKSKGEGERAIETKGNALSASSSIRTMPFRK
jgi:Dyggve-Melchior-Clausen syndrome protein